MAQGFLGTSGWHISDEIHELGFEWTHLPCRGTVVPVQEQGMVVGGLRHKECFVVSEGEQQGKCNGIVDCQGFLCGTERR